MKKDTFHKLRRGLFPVLIAVCVALIGVGSTFAYLAVKTDSVTNTFSAKATELDTKIVENTSGTTKQVIISNVDTVPAYIRARIVISPEDVVDAEYTGTDSTTTVATDNSARPVYAKDDMVTVGTTSYKVAAGQWVYNSADGWYYYLGVVPYGYSTGLLMEQLAAKAGVTYSGNLDAHVYQETVETTRDAAATLSVITAAFAAVNS